MQSSADNPSPNINIVAQCFQILQTTQTQETHATELQHTLTAFNNKNIRLAALVNAFATRWSEGRMGPGMDVTHQTLLKECRDALGPAALMAAVTPGGFKGALGGYANLNRISATFSSSGHSEYIADRSASPSLAPSSSLPGPLANGIEDDENHQLSAADNYSEADAERSTDNGYVSDQLNVSTEYRPHGMIDGPSGLLTRPLLRKSHDHKISMMRYGSEHTHTASSSPHFQSKQRSLDPSTPLGADGNPHSIGTLAIQQSPSILTVERSYNNKLKRARNSGEDGEDDDAEQQAVCNGTRKRKRTTAPTPTQPLPSISLPVERKNLKRARNSVEDREDEDYRPSMRVKFNEVSDVGCVPPRVFGAVSETRRTRIQTQTQARMPKRTNKAATTSRLTPHPLVGRTARSGSVVYRLRKDSFGEIASLDQPSGSVASAPDVLPGRRSIRVRKKADKARQC